MHAIGIVGIGCHGPCILQCHRRQKCKISIICAPTDTIRRAPQHRQDRAHDNAFEVYYSPAARFHSIDTSGDSLPVQPSKRPRARVRCISSLENTVLIASKL